MNWIFGIIIGLNLIISLIYGVFNFKKKKQLALCLMLTFLIIPVLGIVMYGIVNLVIHTNKNKLYLYDSNNLMIHKDNFNYIYRPNLKEELNIIPVEEALVASNVNERRSLIRNILKRDLQVYSRSVKRALSDSDSESTHYAASAITEVYRKLSVGIQNLESQCLSDPNNLPLKLKFSDTLIDYIENSLLSERDRKLNINKFLAIINEIYEKSPSLLTEANYSKQIFFLREIGNKAEAMMWANRFNELFNNEASYMDMLRCCYELGDKNRFMNTLDDLKSSDINLSEKSVDIIRFWIGR